MKIVHDYCVPRARGDEPPFFRAVPRAAAVFPAPAGMSPGSTPDCTAFTSVPRARGGGDTTSGVAT